MKYKEIFFNYNYSYKNKVSYKNTDKQNALIKILRRIKNER